MTLSRPQRLLVAAYPARFRDRYRDELAAATERAGRGWRVAANLARGASRAWLAPEPATEPEQRRSVRLERSIATVFLAWCACVLAGGAFSKGVDDQPLPGLHAWGFTAFRTATVALEVAAGAVGAVGLAYWVRIVVPAWRRRDASVIVPALIPAPIVAAWGGATLLVTWYAHHVVTTSQRHGAPLSAGSVAVLVAYLVVTVASVAGCGAAVVRALDAARLGSTRLRPAMALGSGIVAALALQLVASAVALARVLAVGGIGARDVVLAAVPVVVMAVATAAAGTASVRGLRALRASG